MNKEVCLQTTLVHVGLLALTRGKVTRSIVVLSTIFAILFATEDG